MTAAERFTFRFVDAAEFAPLFKENAPKIFDTILSADIRRLFSPQENEKLDQLKRDFSPRQINLVVYDHDNLVGWSHNVQKNHDNLYMKNSAVLENYRRQGVYSHMLTLVVEQAKILGFQEITSDHHCTNSSVLVAKLKAGFIISGFEINDKYGIFVKLTRFINKEREQLFRFRVGEERLPAVLKEKLGLQLEK